MSEELFDIPASKPPKSKCEVLKDRYSIKTHFANMVCEGVDWLALYPMNEEDKAKDIATIMSESCRLYEEAGYCCEGVTEEEAVIALCKQVGLSLHFSIFNQCK